jgi:hypothetical protein
MLIGVFLLIFPLISAYGHISKGHLSHCSIVVKIWKQLGGYTPLDPETLGDRDCCDKSKSLIPGILCSEMAFVVEIV